MEEVFEKEISFLARDSIAYMLSAVYVIARTSVCPSICPPHK